MSTTATTRYFATVTAGLERVAWQDCARMVPGARLVRLDHRTLLFDYDGPPHLLTGLRAIDDLFIFVGELADIGMTRAALADIRAQVATFSLESSAALCRAIREISSMPSYAITANYVGARTYSRYEIAAAVAAGVAERHNWQYVENTPEEHGPHDLDLRVVLQGERGLVGMRLTAQPLHRRPYKLASRPGSLKAPVAYAMAFLAGIVSGERILDPCCGVGTIPLEAAQLVHPTVVLASDLSSEAVADARINSSNSPFEIALFAADAGALPIANDALDAVVSNLPFGRQVAVEDDIETAYSAILSEIARVLRVGGRAALLTDQGDAFMTAMRGTPSFRLVAAHQISLFGLHPIIYVLHRRPLSID